MPSRRRAVLVLFCVAMACFSSGQVYGQEEAAPRTSTPEATPEPSTRYIPVALSVLPIPVFSNTHEDKEATHALSLGVLTFGRRLEGVEVALATVRTGDVNGLQVAWINWLQGQLNGVQMSAGVNHVEGGFRGAQTSLVGNESLRLSYGAQLGLMFNISDTLSGVQGTLLYNQAERLKGLQVGLINVGGEVSGAQLGLLNIADKVDGASIGLLNIVDGGIFNLDVWSSDVATSHVGLRTGNSAVYTLLTAAWRAEGWDGFDSGAGMLGLGVGGRLQLSRVMDLDVDAVGYQGKADGLARVRASVRYQPVEGFALFGGPALNLRGVGLGKVGPGVFGGLSLGTGLF